ncbi:hypothetical protein EK904_008289 [Melospiza melodia maxima]|nr:hypothetical protein EK904_008289 [Melospiza melodia maxima]
MMKRQFNRMRQQLSHPSATTRAQEATELLSEDLLQIEQRIEPAKRAAHSVSKRLQACLQGQCGSEMDKRVLLEVQAQYHRQSLESLDSALAELRESHRQTEPSFTTDTPVAGYYGVSLETHLKSLGREIALPIEACVMMLLASGMKEEGLFRLAAGASVLRKLKSSLASGSNALEEFYSDPHAVAGALKSYLRELPQPLMTFELYDEWVKAASLKDIDSRLQSLRDTCGRLPQDSYNNLRWYLIKFLAKLAEHQEVNKMTPSNIAIVLGPNLLWSQQSTGDPMQLDLASVSSIQVVVEALIQNVDTLFPGEKFPPLPPCPDPVNNCASVHLKGRRDQFEGFFLCQTDKL